MSSCSNVIREGESTAEGREEARERGKEAGRGEGEGREVCFSCWGLACFIAVGWWGF